MDDDCFFRGGAVGLDRNDIPCEISPHSAPPRDGEGSGGHEEKQNAGSKRKVPAIENRSGETGHGT